MNDDLEAIDGLCAKIIEQRDRIEALEAALRYTAETAAGELNYTGQSRSTRAALQNINGMARTALAPEDNNDKTQ